MKGCMQTSVPYYILLQSCSLFTEEPEAQVTQTKVIASNIMDYYYPQLLCLIFTWKDLMGYVQKDL